MARTVYFGTPGHMAWVPAPTINMPRSTVGWANKSDRINGTTGIKRSAGVHREYSMDWAVKSLAQISHVLAVLNGDYGMDGVYFLDPFAVLGNAAPDAWASPWKACQGGVNLAGSSAPMPESVTTTSNTYGFPDKTAHYVLDGTETTVELWLPRPDEYDIHIEVSATATGSADVLLNGSGATKHAVTSGVVPANHITSGTGATVKLTGTGTIDLTALSVLYTPHGASNPTVRPWGVGQGAGALQPTAAPTQGGYSAALDLQSLSVVLAEVN